MEGSGCRVARRLEMAAGLRVQLRCAGPSCLTLARHGRDLHDVRGGQDAR
eukprot:CAMPEP_0204597254 /NCGR_PEP_ID=MMETSP0661-20131031/53707_1 /ASSEMBLY_ACC=CAM_ASM_000606 /TAXON_ID=109239 /ORGANISM="Alexandrium margalefi, Strain AMGDE01CS-322" /LENGTH=49 /DNA_ID= /DNA_START= /DNA_END= /DNA_ORIENTATION=